MKILFVADTPLCWQHGIWFHRINIPSTALSDRGHGIKLVAMGSEFKNELLDWPDTVIFGRTYPAQYDPIKWIREFKNRGKRVLYDIDDDFWKVRKDNPSVNVSNALKDQYEGMIREADAVITPSKVLAKKFKKYFKKSVFICPNGIDYKLYQLRPKNKPGLVIGYAGAASHFKDLQLIGEVINKLSEKYDFVFNIYGLVGESLEAAMYTYQKLLHSNYKPEQNAYFKEALDFYAQLKSCKVWHIPFVPPELHPTMLAQCDFDIGLAPLEDTEFNRGKSCIKFYEYASVGSVVLASDVLPYSDECNYRAKNTHKDWYNKLEKLIVDREFREKVGKIQQEWVKKYRSTEAIGLDWELACQRPGGLKVLNQRKVK